MLVLEGNIEGEQQLSRRLGVIADGVADFSDPLEESSKLLLKTFDQNFTTKGATLGKPWRPRKAIYRKGARIDTWPLLQKTGDMRESFVHAVTKTEAHIGNTSDYFGYHQSNMPRTRMPRRVMMRIDEQRRREIIRNFQQFLTEILRNRS